MDDKSDVESWLRNEGAKFLRKIGLKPGDRVVDFGCGSGHYSIPAAQVVGREGKVFAVDEDRKLLLEFEKIARREGLSNILTLNTRGQFNIELPDKSLDVILAYDVLHYFDKRKILFSEFNRLLRKGGLFSVYPKHYKEDYPLRSLAQLSLKDITQEIEEAGFSLQKRLFARLIHDDNYGRGYILNFSPAIKNREIR